MAPSIWAKRVDAPHPENLGVGAEGLQSIDHVCPLYLSCSYAPLEPRMDGGWWQFLEAPRGLRRSLAPRPVVRFVGVGARLQLRVQPRVILNPCANALTVRIDQVWRK